MRPPPAVSGRWTGHPSAFGTTEDPVRSGQSVVVLIITGAKRSEVVITVLGLRPCGKDGRLVHRRDAGDARSGEEVERRQALGPGEDHDR